VIGNIFSNYKKKWENYRDNHKQKQALEKFSEQMPGFFNFFALIIFSGIIAGFGISQGNEAVIIGAMLITPLIPPLVGIALGVLTGNFGIFWDSFWRSIFGVLALFLIAFTIGHFFDFKINDSFLLRAELVSVPDIFIAVSAGIVAALSFVSHKIHSHVSGAAISISITPPLVVSGIGLAKNDFFIFENALRISAINIIGIVGMAFIIFAIFGFRKPEPT